MRENMNFSFVLPTLGDQERVRKFLDSLERTTKYKNKIEVFFAIDEGKTEIIDYVKNRNYSFYIEFHERPQTKDFTNDYYNFLADRTIGKNVIAFNDDAWMRTQDWDAKILRTIKEYGWSIYMLDILDTARMKYGNSFPCFPCVSRRAMNTLGWLLCRDIAMYPADKVTHAVYHEANRVIPIRNILIEHEHISEDDPSKARMMEIFRETNKPIIDITEYTLKIAATAAAENNIKQNKFNRILNIIKEG